MHREVSAQKEQAATCLLEPVFFENWKLNLVWSSLTVSDCLRILQTKCPFFSPAPLVLEIIQNGDVPAISYSTEPYDKWLDHRLKSSVH